MAGLVSMISRNRVNPAMPIMYCSAKAASRLMGEVKVEMYRVKVMRVTVSSCRR